jgi:predicted acetyltransferase
MAEYPDEPWYDPEHLLVAEIDGRVVSQMGIRDGHLWIAGHPCPAGLVGTVCTLPEYRGRGIGARMIQASLGWMAKRGLALSYLHTIPERYAFYGRQGYKLSVIHEPKAVLHPGDGRTVGDTPEGINIRRASRGDARACKKLYEEHYGRMSGAWSRTEVFWERRLSGKPKLWSPGIPEFWVAESPEVQAYLALVREPDCRIVELAARPGSGEDAAVALVSAVIQDGPSGEVGITLSPRDPLWDRLAAFRPEDRSGEGHVMLRVQDRGCFLDCAETILAPRARAEAIAPEVQFTDGGPPLRVEDSGRPLVVAASIHDLCALVYNGKRLDALVEDGSVDRREGAPEDLRAVFPDTLSARCPLDGY